MFDAINAEAHRDKAMRQLTENKSASRHGRRGSKTTTSMEAHQSPAETPNFALAVRPCPVASIAAKYRRTIDKFNELDERRSRDTDPRIKENLAALLVRETALQEEASFEKAHSIEGALFQIALASSFAELAVHSSGWQRGDRGPPEEPFAAKQAIYRLLHSAAQAIAAVHDVHERTYAGDYHLGVDPLEFMGG